MLINGFDVRVLGLAGHQTGANGPPELSCISLGHGLPPGSSRPNSYNACRPNGVNVVKQPQRDSNPCRHLERASRLVR